VTVQVDLLPPAAAADEVLVESIARVVNDAYAIGEEGLWVEGAARVEPADVADAIRDSGMLSATLDDQVVGCARVQRLDRTTADLGLISVAPERWGAGVGGELIEAAERLIRSRHFSAVQLELLVPQGWVHPAKERLRAWYLRLGYSIVRSAPFEEVASQLAPQLATPCEFLIFRKSLA
jgi:GNAT superfamily N-acetyltransferase